MRASLVFISQIGELKLEVGSGARNMYVLAESYTSFLDRKAPQQLDMTKNLKKERKKGANKENLSLSLL